MRSSASPYIVFSEKQGTIYGKPAIDGLAGPNCRGGAFFLFDKAFQE
jgi:hypothetical protein